MTESLSSSLAINPSNEITVQMVDSSHLMPLNTDPIDSRQEMIKLMQKPDTICVSGSKKWFTSLHKMLLPKIKPFGDEDDRNVMIRQIIGRHDSQSALIGIVANLLEVLFNEHDRKTLTAGRLLHNEVFENLWKFVSLKISLDAVDRKRLSGVLGEYRQRSDHSSAIPSSRKVVSNLDVKGIYAMMKQVLEKESKGRLKKKNEKFIDWFTDWHQENLNKLVVFDSYLDDKLRDILRLESSQRSIMRVSTNLIRILWKKDDLPQLTSSIIRRNPFFIKIMSFVNHGKPADQVKKQRHSLKNALLNLQKPKKRKKRKVVKKKKAKDNRNRIVSKSSMNVGN